MKSILVIIVFLTTMGHAQKDLAMVNSKKDVEKTSEIFEEDKIKAVIIKETEAFSNHDINAWRACFTQSSQTAYVYRWPDGTTGQIVGFKNLEKMVESWMEGEEDSVYKTLERVDWNIKIKDNMAWVTYKEKANIDGDEHLIEEIRILEKIKGVWKLDMIGYVF